MIIFVSADYHESPAFAQFESKRARLKLRDGPVPATLQPPQLGQHPCLGGVPPNPSRDITAKAIAAEFRGTMLALPTRVRVFENVARPPTAA
jgi:hypothetical protein